MTRVVEADAALVRPVASELVPPLGTPARRRVGFLLAVFGAVGLFVVGTALVFVLRPVEAEEGLFGIEANRRQLVALLEASDDAMETAEVAARDADGSLGSTADAAGSAATLMTELSTTMRTLAASLRIDVLGTQPFALAANDMDRVADQAGTVATDLDVAASSVRLAAGDMAALAADLGEMRRELSEIRGRLDEPIETDTWRLLLAALFGWLAIPAAVSLVLGVRWLRPARRGRAPAGRA